MRCRQINQSACRFASGGRVLALASLLALLSGCKFYEQLRGNGFATRETVSEKIRGEDTDAKPSGYFTDKRSDEIEKHLGGF
jgi:hypothetical protein